MAMEVVTSYAIDTGGMNNTDRGILCDDLSAVQKAVQGLPKEDQYDTACKLMHHFRPQYQDTTLYQRMCLMFLKD